MARTSDPKKKVKGSYSLSAGNVDYLQQLRKKHRARSVSAVLDEILLEARRQQQLKEYEEKMTAYYESMTEEEREEDRAWGELGSRTLAEMDFGWKIDG